MIVYHFIAMIAGCALDAFIGDPRWLPHPVCAIGRLVAFLEKRLRAFFPKDERGERLAGGFMVFFVLLLTGLAVLLILAAAYRVSIAAGIAAESVMCGQMMAFRSLKKESMRVYYALEAGDAELARAYVSMIVGRDTGGLTDEGIARAAVETVAENTSDGVVAPLLFMAFGGGLGICLYKAVNTMDSMTGYKNEAYLNFGRTAARLDDVCNFVPARLCAGFMMAAGFLLEGFERLGGRKPGENGHWNGMGGVRIFLRDRHNHKSPNSAQTESVCAGALGIRLAGDAWYFGRLCKKPFIGDDDRRIEYEDIRRAGRLMEGTYVLALLVTAAVLMLLADWGFS